MRTAPIRPGTRRGIRRLRARIRTAVAVAALGALAVGGALVVAPAQAAAPAPRLKVVAGDHALTAAWSGVAGASSYTVRVSRARSLSHAKVVTTTKRSVRITRLTNGSPYFVAVTPNRTAFTAAVARSAVVSTKPAAGVPFPVGKVTVSSGPAANQVTVTWAGGGRASKVAVVAGSDVLTKVRSFHSAWYPATTRSIVLTVPERYRDTLGAGSGNPVWVKVVQSNGPSNAYGASYSYARKYRPSPPGTWAFAKAVVAPASVSKVVVAELNTQSVGATAHFSAQNRWAARAQRVADAINTTSPKPAVLLTAELATNVLDGCSNTGAEPYRCRSHTQVADLAKRLHGLRLADTDTYDRVMDRQRSSSKWQANVTDGAHVFYDPDRLTLLDHGYYSPAMSPSSDFLNVQGLGVTWDPRSAVGGDRWISWAELELKDGSGRRFYAVAAHFPVGDQKVVVDARASLAKKLVAAIDRRAGGVPVVFGGDLNTDAVRSTKAVQPVFAADGWFDAAAVSAKHLRTGMKVSTANSSGPQDGADNGYGSRPNRHQYETSRIDYILLKNSPHTYSYANVLRLHANGTFIRKYQGTDHNMQLATIGIGDPVGS